MTLPGKSDFWDATRIGAFWRVDHNEVCQTVVQVKPRRRFTLQFPKPELLGEPFTPATFLELTIIPLDLSEAELAVLAGGLR